MKVHQYILDNWNTTIRDPNSPRDANLSFLKIPNKYTTPCADDEFQNFYYWDTYFTNLGLLEDGLVDIARDNLRVMKYFVDRLCFIPNADHLVQGSQPPFFTRGIYDLYQKTKDINDIKEFIYGAATEMEFWKFDRMTPCGLNQFGNSWPNCKCNAAYGYFDQRCGGFNEEERKLGRVLMTQNMFAIAESGWDLNVRYRRNGVRYDSLSYANIDLNCILFDAESKIAEMAKIIGDDALAKEFEQRKEARRKLMDSLMKDPETGIYYDYCFKDNKVSKFLTVASLFPYTVGLSNDQKTAKEVFDRLDFEYGLSTAEYRGEDQYLQWDYPHMWPPVVYLAYLGLKNVGLDEEAKLLRKQYMGTVESCFEETGKLWEKYNTITGKVSVTVEYKTPTMMGWTAGVYEFLLKE